MSDAIDRVHYVSQLFGITLIMNSKRKAFLLNKYQTALNAAITASNDTRLNSPEKLFSAINSLDPCPKGKYTDWLIRRIFDGDILVPDTLGSTFHDLNSELAIALKAFHKHKQFLPIKDINRLPSTRSLVELTTSSSGSELPISNRAKKKKYKEHLLENGDIECLHKSKVCTLYKINTKEGAVFLGRGTRWCTAGGEHNSFDQYHNDGPLYVLIDNKGDKYQLHFPTGLLCDENDCLISPIVAGSYFHAVRRDLEENLPDFSFKALISSEILGIKHCLKFLTDNESGIKYIPQELLTIELFQKLIPSNGKFLKHMPKEMVTKELCINAVRNDGDSIEYVPEKILDYQICLLAVKESGVSLQYIPKKLISYELCYESLQLYFSGFSFVPDKFKTDELIAKALMTKPSLVQEIPPEKISSEVYYLIAEHKPEVYDLIAEHNPEYLIDLPPEHLTDELTTKLIHHDNVFPSMPYTLKTYDVCFEAVTQNILNITHIPTYILLSTRFLEEFIRTPKFSLKLINVFIQDPILCELAVTKDGMELEFISPKLKTKELIYTAIEENIHALYFLSGDDWDLELCKYAISLSDEAYQYIPERFKRLIPYSKFEDNNDDYFY